MHPTSLLSLCPRFKLAFKRLKFIIQTCQCDFHMDKRVGCMKSQLPVNFNERRNVTMFAPQPIIAQVSAQGFFYPIIDVESSYSPPRHNFSISEIQGSNLSSLDLIYSCISLSATPSHFMLDVCPKDRFFFEEFQKFICTNKLKFLVGGITKCNVDFSAQLYAPRA